jgi:hypothetical protein
MLVLDPAERESVQRVYDVLQEEAMRHDHQGCIGHMLGSCGDSFRALIAIDDIAANQDGERTGLEDRETRHHAAAPRHF